ncbi:MULTISPECIES: SDR family oxidoreductase [unclassified Mesorhizobium]|uniref:SDR family oxidoreductase n=1 Tax=unclassified Mesorhizobium TaxID=325217 RepID=UPI00333D2586
MLPSHFKLKPRASNGAPGAAEAAASDDVAHGHQIRPTEPSVLIEKFVLRVAYRTLVPEPLNVQTQLSILRLQRGTPTSPPKTAPASPTTWVGRHDAGEGVRDGAVCRNELETRMLRTGFAARWPDPNKAVADLDDSAPLGRVARPKDVADGVLLLASDAALYMCGALVEVNGGKAVA